MRSILSAIRRALRPARAFSSDAATHYVIVHSSNQDEPIEPVSPHVRHRHFTRWVETSIPAECVLAERIANDFYIYKQC